MVRLFTPGLSIYLPLSCPSISIRPWVVHLSRVGHLGPQREVVAQELHDERGVLVRLFAQRVEVRDRVVKRLPKCVYRLVLESQLPYRIVNALLTITNQILN